MPPKAKATAVPLLAHLTHPEWWVDDEDNRYWIIPTPEEFQADVDWNKDYNILALHPATKDDDFEYFWLNQEARQENNWGKNPLVVKRAPEKVTTKIYINVYPDRSINVFTSEKEAKDNSRNAVKVALPRTTTVEVDPED